MPNYLLVSRRGHEYEPYIVRLDDEKMKDEYPKAPQKRQIRGDVVDNQGRVLEPDHSVRRSMLKIHGPVYEDAAGQIIAPEVKATAHKDRIGW